MSDDDELPPLLADALDSPIFGVDQAGREQRLLPVMRELTDWHAERSPEYRRVLDAMFDAWDRPDRVADVPFLPVGLFKRRTLKSVSDADVFKTLTSSGTTGQSPSRVHLDRTTAKRQTKALTSIMTHMLGRQRRPMLVIDTDAILTDRTSRSARAAGIVGLMTLGRHHTFALDGEMAPSVDRVREFLDTHRGEPLLIFGFTFMVWQYLVGEMSDLDLDLSAATLVHSGGWKKLAEQQVGNDEFKAILRDRFGLESVVNFYGMAEQVGSVFVEGPEGHLHPSTFADVIVRDPQTWQPVPDGEQGVIQVLSAVPTSYPGHSILTEDLGRIVSTDADASFGGRAFVVEGRLPRSELRGCSDTYAADRRG